MREISSDLFVLTDLLYRKFRAATSLAFAAAYSEGK